MHTPGAPPLSASIRMPRGHAHAQGKDALEDQFVRTSLRACHAQGRDPRLCGSTVGGHRFAGVGTPRRRLTKCSEVAAAFEHWGESRGVINGDLGDLCSSEQCPRLGL